MDQKDSFQPIIIIPAFKRKHSLQRLLHSLNEADYPPGNVKLVISLDRGATNDVIETAESFTFTSGTTEVLKQEKHLGVSKHIMQCVDFAVEDGSAIVLEDDLVVGPNFYWFASQSLAFYAQDEKVGGISLYAQRYNETAELPFEPLYATWSVYLMQLACSWGQAWTKMQWNDFRLWYNEFEGSLIDSQKLPQNVKDWPETSWKKYFTQYLIEKQKYIVYPYQSHTTNVAARGGVHMDREKNVGNLFQVPLDILKKTNRSLNLPKFQDEPVIYDSFMEPDGAYFESIIGIPNDIMEVDLYGSKPKSLLLEKKYALSSKEGTGGLKSYPLQFRPLEVNIKFEADSGENSFFHLYQTETLNCEEKITSKQYILFAEYFSYFRLKTRKFAFGYLRRILSEFWGLKFKK